MAEYLPLFIPGKAYTRQASAAIVAGNLVRVSGSGTVAPTSAASADWVGVAANDAANGDDVLVFSEGIQRLVASGTIAAGATVEGAASGQVASHSNGTADYNIVGLALTSATVGLLVEVSMLR